MDDHHDIFTNEPEYEALSPSSEADRLAAEIVSVKPDGGKDARDHKKE
jgi:hypothetical protein